MTNASVPLLRGDPAAPVLLRTDGSAIDRATLLRQIHALAAQLPDAPSVINVCESRHHFLVALCAAAVRGQVSLMPPSRAPESIADIAARYPGSTVVGDNASVAGTTWMLPHVLDEIDVADVPQIAADDTAVIVFTSGSTGIPSANSKAWASMQRTTAANKACLQHLAGHNGSSPVVATVPPQHMYGMETSVLLPLFEDFAIHEGRPFFPVDVADALSTCDRPALLVTTPVHLRALVESDVVFPPIAGIVTATAPLSVELAAAAETRFACELREMFGATETCVIAHRRTAKMKTWQLYDDVTLTPDEEGTWVTREAYASPIRISDIVACTSEGRKFELLGRQADLLEIAGKRASLADLNRLLLQAPGVSDGVMLQTHITNRSGTRRMVAVVSGACNDTQIIDYLRNFIDPVFLPKRIHHVAALPRNETGKLSRADLLALTGD
jgi:acyl-coenzyme A synthetase/AMP-(fatty) acid ligase